jgi:hypothetical protein
MLPAGQPSCWPWLLFPVQQLQQLAQLVGGKQKAQSMADVVQLSTAVLRTAGIYYTPSRDTGLFSLLCRSLWVVCTKSRVMLQMQARACGMALALAVGLDFCPPP